MHWENSTGDWPELPESEIPGELLDGLERLSADGDIFKARLRWRPHQTSATGFLTKDRLLQLRGEPVLEIARALASLATHLHDEGGCENKFEAQIQRELEARNPESARDREWRSITFYVNQPQPPPSDHDVPDDDYESPHHHSPVWASPVPLASSFPDDHEYTNVTERLRTDPVALLVVMMQHSNDRTVSLLERLLMSSVTRLDRVLATQISNSRYLNEALQTLTKGASDVAARGMDLFNQGLEQHARVARMEHETELGKERTELMRDAVKQGSLLIQAVLMSQTAKQQQRARTPAPSAAAPPSTPGPASSSSSNSGSTSASPGPSDSPPFGPSPAESPAAPSGADAEIEAKARRVLSLVTDDVLEDLRAVSPSLVEVFRELQSQ
ncbi:MAG TPA: hypothetical protein VK034_27420, partial [Enhygromyxa sp.]|nr:hypothetical protein [Enhygromyxa sp.]